jgi:hypothetical protein
MDNNHISQTAPVPVQPVMPQLPPQHEIDRFIGASWEIYQAMFPKFMQVYIKFLIKLIVYAVPGILLVVGVAVYERTADLSFINSDYGLAMLVGIVYFVPVCIYLALWWELSLLHTVRLRQVQPELNVDEVIAIAKPQVPGFFWVGFLSGLLTFTWALLFIIPGIIFGLYYSLSEYVFADTNKRGLEAIRISKAYIKGYWWKTVHSLLGLAAVMVLIYIATSVLSAIAGEYVGPFVSAVVNMISVPYSIIYVMLLYERFKQIKPELHPVSHG